MYRGRRRSVSEFSFPRSSPSCPPLPSCLSNRCPASNLLSLSRPHRVKTLNRAAAERALERRVDDTLAAEAALRTVQCPFFPPLYFGRPRALPLPLVSPNTHRHYPESRACVYVYNVRFFSLRLIIIKGGGTLGPDASRPHGPKEKTTHLGSPKALSKKRRQISHLR